ncbi:unnamed protein product [Paramecium octaurelia]|uniref:Uncharacterized protein n=1 Tax=Paramecium octaurelia TaxID=43137 RepID=A0A8S1W747_PAROT|nr:unnamed protein product [Paramecium octaurelia]
MATKESEELFRLQCDLIVKSMRYGEDGPIGYKQKNSMGYIFLQKISTSLTQPLGCLIFGQGKESLNLQIQSKISQKKVQLGQFFETLRILNHLLVYLQ